MLEGVKKSSISVISAILIAAGLERERDFDFAHQGMVEPGLGGAAAPGALGTSGDGAMGSGGDGDKW